MSVRIYCQCGTDVTDEVSPWDWKTRTLFLMEQHPPSCAACRKRPTASRAKRATAPMARGVETRKKVAVS